MSDSVTSWLNAASRAPLLTAAEEIHLAILIRQGRSDDATPGQRRAGARAKQRMITANLRLVATVSRRFLPRLRRTSGLGHEDLLQEGTLGLNRAVEKFDPEAGYKFSTYAYWWVQQAIGRLIYAQGSTIYLPSSTQTLLSKAHFAPPEARCSRAAMQDYLGASEAEMQRLEAGLLATSISSLDSHRAGDDTSSTLLEHLADPASQPDLEALDREIAIAALEAAGVDDELALVTLNIEGVSARQLGELQDQSASKTLKQLEQARRRLATIAAGHRNLIAA